MKSFFNRREEEIEEVWEDEDDELEIINLDETAGWSKLDVAEELAKRQAEEFMEELGDELAIIDVVEEDIEMEELKPQQAPKKSTYTAAKVPEKVLQELSEEDLESGEDAEEELEVDMERLEDEDIEYLSEDDDEEEEEEYEEESAFAFFENLAGWFGRWTVLDKVVAVVGVLVLAVAIVTVGVYAGDRGVNKQLEAFAPVGEQLETIGVAGQDKLLAVADAKKAMLEAAKLEAELNQEYEENELSTEVKVVMKMTSVQKDLKIKFINKKTGKLVGNVPFEVKITDSENKTYNKIDEDMDGIIYMTQIVPGNYSVSMVELAEVEGYSFSTAVEKIKVKENIEYQKIDVSEEIKDQSEVDVSKEDTAQKTETEGALTDTVEWVESTKKESDSQETYTPVDKSTIADPSLSASLKLDLGILRIMQQSMLATDTAVAADESVTTPVTTDTTTPVTEGETPPATGENQNSTESENGNGGETTQNKPENIAVTGITLNAAASVEKGKTTTLSATVAPENATDKSVTWSSNNEGVATVNAGVVTGVSAGKATITAAAGGFSASCEVTVTEPAPAVIAVTGISISPAATASVEKGKTTTLSATIVPENATDKSVTWSSNSEAVATVNAGVVTGVSAGKATITATAGGFSASCEVTVTEPAPAVVAVTGVTLNKAAMELTVEAEEALTAVVAPEGASNKKVSWTSSDTAVATVDVNGKVKGIKEGTATITVTTEDGNKTAACTVTVKAKPVIAVESIVVNPAAVTLEIGKTTVLGVVVTPENAADKTVTWKSSDESKATVDAKGCVTAKAEGTVTITATSKDGSKTAACTVTIPKGYDPTTDTTKLLKDKSGNQIYVLVDGQYVEAKVADYYKSGITFYKKETVSQYIYTGWQNLDGKTYYFDKNGNKVTGEQVIQGAKYNFNSDGTLNTGSGILGIDVSTWNGNIDWNKVKNSGVSYVIIRTGFRGSTQGALVEDNKFRQNIQGATNAGLKVGVYFFSQAINEVEAVEEASMVLSQVKGYKLTYPVFIDVEPSGGRADGLSSGDRTKVINAFCQTIQNGGLRAGVYANKTWLSQKMNVSALSGYKIWLAQYNSKVTYTGRYDMWQYSEKGKVAGISGNVDMNLSYLSY